MTILAYVVTIGLAVVGLTALPITLAGGLVARMSGHGGLLLGMLVGGLLTWVGLEWLWLTLEGGMIPLTVFAVSFVAIGAHGAMAGNKLNPMAQRAMGAEMWAILGVALGVAFMSGSMRWY